MSRSKIIRDKAKSKAFNKLKNNKRRYSRNCSCGQDGSGLIGKVYFSPISIEPKSIISQNDSKKKALEFLNSCEQGLYNLDTGEYTVIREKVVKIDVKNNS